MKTSYESSMTLCILSAMWVDREMSRGNTSSATFAAMLALWWAIVSIKRLFTNKDA